MRTRVKYGLYGVLFGILFPLLATCIEMMRQDLPCTLSEIVSLHSRTPLLLIINTAPIFLGLFSMLIGITTEKLVSVQQREKKVLQSHNDELEKRNAELKELNAMLDGLVYTASHDLKTPVINFRSMLTMLKKVRQKPDQRAMEDSIIEKLEKATGKFQSTISDLLDISRLEKQFGEDFSKVNVGETVTQVMESVSEMVTQKEAQVQLSLSGAPHIWFSQASLHSILLNLISNSLKYSASQRKPEIQIRTSTQLSQLVLEVQDNGIGMDMEMVKTKLFRMFTRMSSQAEGSGIGLYIVKRTVEKSNGKVEVESQLDKGSLFRITLPIQQEKWENSRA
jgi:signal transduction histidine kinase